MTNNQMNPGRDMRIVESPQKPHEFLVQSRRSWDDGEHRTIATFHRMGYGMAGGNPGDAERDALMLVAANQIVGAMRAAQKNLDSRGRELAISLVDSTPITGGEPDEDIAADVRANHRAQAILKKIMDDAVPSELSLKWAESAKGTWV